jgi:hypothetical protein
MLLAALSDEANWEQGKFLHKLLAYLRKQWASPRTSGAWRTSTWQEECETTDRSRRTTQFSSGGGTSKFHAPETYRAAAPAVAPRSASGLSPDS